MFIHQLRALREHIHVNKQLIVTMKINKNHADELILSEFTHFRTAHIYKLADKVLINKNNNNNHKKNCPTHVICCFKLCVF
jgi:hypothetical protein